MCCKIFYFWMYFLKSTKLYIIIFCNLLRICQLSSSCSPKLHYLVNFCIKFFFLNSKYISKHLSRAISLYIWHALVSVNLNYFWSTWVNAFVFRHVLLRFGWLLSRINNRRNCGGMRGVRGRVTVQRFCLAAVRVMTGRVCEFVE